ncbi:MAG: MBL fold metallo-hydrolase [Solobacterium sp.]|nr:MBL fold metallo-hydrolase [Solobacterium sp.]
MALDIHALPINKKFNRRLIAPDTWIINPFNPNFGTPRPYVLIGDDCAALIDATHTTLPIREYIEKCVTDKPLVVLCTHSHLDHTNDNYLFEDCDIYMSEYAWNEIKARRDMDNKAGMWRFSDPACGDVEMTPEQRGTYTPKILKPGDTIDLGNRVIEVLPYVGCHSPGSLIFFDHKTGGLFTGDELETGQMLVMGQPGTKSCVEQLRENLQVLIDGWYDRITMVCPAHNGSPIHPQFLKDLAENCDRVLSGIEGDMDVRSMSFAADPDSMGGRARIWMEDPDILRSEWKGTSIVYNRTRLHKADIVGK